MSLQHWLGPIKDSGWQMYELSERLYPICRSITGDGVRETLKILQEYMPLEIEEIPSGTKVFDWTVPKEWNVREAWVKDAAGRKIIDFAKHNLHLLNYSIPIHQKMSLADLRPHLHSLPDQPTLIPYRTSYYQENWGFCLTHQQYEKLEEGTYEVFIDSSLTEGHLTFGTLLIPGKTEEEILLSTHICHPSLANDNLSGISILTQLAQFIQQGDRHYSYRFLFLPGTIGAISWLALHQDHLARIKGGWVTALLGDDGAFTYKRSRRGDTEIDRITEYVLATTGHAHQVIDFIPYGYDERQFCSPGINLAMGNLGRTPFGQFPEYHTSADNMDFIRPENLQQSFQLFCQMVAVLEGNRTYQNLAPYCEPQLGKRGLYSAIGGDNDRKERQMAMLWLLNLSDGQNSLLEIAQRSGLSFALLAEMADVLMEHQLLDLYPSSI
ncbi:MAG: DUF4910 domain-containing protein [Bacteroidota bacterium]